MPCERFMLVHQSKIVQRFGSLGEWGIKRDATLTLTLRMLGGSGIPGEWHCALCNRVGAGTPKLGAFAVGPVEQRVRPFFVVLLRGLRCLAKALPRVRELGRVLVLRLRENSATRGDRLRLLVLSSLMLPRFMCLVQTSASRQILLRLS